jgi:hypothetical protein
MEEIQPVKFCTLLEETLEEECMRDPIEIRIEVNVARLLRCKKRVTVI